MRPAEPKSSRSLKRQGIDHQQTRKVVARVSSHAGIWGISVYAGKRQQDWSWNRAVVRALGLLRLALLCVSGPCNGNFSPLSGRLVCLRAKLFLVAKANFLPIHFFMRPHCAAETGLYVVLHGPRKAFTLCHPQWGGVIHQLNNKEKQRLVSFVCSVSWPPF